MMEFLYFPDDKSEYIPAVITLTIFMIGAVVMMLVLMKKSKKEEKNFAKQFKESNRTDSNTIESK